MLKHRLVSGILIIIAVLVALFWLPAPGLLVVLLAVSIMAQWEFYALLDKTGIPHFKYVGLIGGVVLIVVTWSHPTRACEGEGLVLAAVTAAILLRQFPQKDNPRPLETIAGTLLGVMYVPVLFNFFTKLLTHWGDAQGRMLVFYLIMIAKLTDVGAYFVGCSVGRHKLIPRISPAKTWEGVVGGGLTGILASVLFWISGRGHLGNLAMSFPDAVVLGFLLVVAGTVGDLTESLVKRAAAVKDSGTLIAGMGGLLDVIDSLLFAAPMMYVYARFFLR